LGVPTVEENLGHLGKATQLAISRLERKLETQGKDLDDFRDRLESKEFVDTLSAAVLQTQRTNDKKRLNRLASIIANSVEVNNLGADQTDDMMRAAVELKDEDISLLRKLYDSQNSLVTRLLSNPGQDPTYWHREVQRIWKEFTNRGGLNPQEHLNYRSSFSRLESLGLIQYVNSAGSYGVGRDIYALLAEGKKFFERIQEIAAQ
jgi:hypothetical protein